MAKLCDDIERFILNLLEEQTQVEIQRNILAARFSCAPSQINYVLTTRFTPVQGSAWSRAAAAAGSFA